MTTGTLTLAEFLLAQIAEDEEEYQTEERTANPGPWDRLLAKCEAERRIVEGHDLHMHASGEWTCDTGERWWPVGFDYNEDTGSGEPDRSGGCLTLRLLALPYADHPDYDERWKP